MATFYVSHRAPNPRRVLLFLAEKGLYDPDDHRLTGALERDCLEEVDIFRGEHRTDAYKAISPLRQIPALQLDDGRCLTESRSICQYIEALHPDPPLFGGDAFDRAQIDMWDRRVEYLLFLPAAMVVRHTHPVFAAIERQLPEYGARMAEKFDKTRRFLDRTLADTRFIAGDTISVADITAVCAIDFARLARSRVDAAETPHLARWYGTMRARPSYPAGL